MKAVDTLLDLGGGSAHWTVRRRGIVLITIFCMGMIVFTTVYVEDDTRFKQLIEVCFGTIEWLWAGLVAGAVVDDALRARNETKAAGSKPVLTPEAKPE